MVIRFSDTKKIISGVGEIWDYSLPSEDVGVSYQKLNGRGPQQGFYLNKVCHEIYFIIAGSGVFHINNQRHEVGEKDVVIVEPNTKHFIEANNLEHITITRPNWYESQFEEVKD